MFTLCLKNTFSSCDLHIIEHILFLYKQWMHDWREICKVIIIRTMETWT